MVDSATIWQEADRRFAAFLAASVSPGSASRDARGEVIPREVLRAAAHTGLVGFNAPCDVGGEGRDVVAWGLVLERVGYLCDDLSLPLLLGVQAALVETIHDTGRQDLIERYVIPAVRGERFCSFCYTEDADPFAFSSVAHRRNGKFVVDGEKVMVTGGAIADVFMTYVRTDSGDLQVILIERQDNGVETVPIPLMGLRAAGLSRVRFANTEVPADRVMVRADGLAHAQRFLNRRRLLLTCAPLGRMRAILESCVERLSTRVRYGRPLTEMQHVQAIVGKMFIAIETSSLVVHGALERLAAQRNDAIWDTTISAAKHFVAQQAIDVAQCALQLLGGQGYTAGEPAARALRDFMGFIAGAGAQSILQVDLGVTAISAVQRNSLREES